MGFKKKENMYLYTEKELDLYEKYITEQFGEYTEVFHELASIDIHLDIIIVPPTEKNNYYKLITMGMGAYKMKSEKEQDYWPIRQLKILARLPIQNNTWLGYGHTISSDQENTPYANDTKFCSIMLLNALNSHNEELNLQMGKKGKINFYQLFPLYREELEYKQKTDANTLLKLFNDKDIIPIVNNYRRNYGINI